ncbi:MAG: hypothetical protein IT179_13405 [Acidobacteria bacterium]|nr:hypothetical protein [Acidobacteriota bacterium]
MDAREKYGRVLMGASAASVTVTCRRSTPPGVSAAGDSVPSSLACQPREVSSLTASGVMLTPPRLPIWTRTAKACPGTTAPITGGGANMAPGPVGSGTPAGCATAVRSSPSAVLMAN